MRALFMVLALFGVIVSSLALREHYRTDISPCDINEKWDCGIVNRSIFAVVHGVPVAVIGIAGYFLIGGLAFMRVYRALLAAALAGLAFSLYLTHVEASVLGVWCVYCVASLTIISLTTILAIVMVTSKMFRRPGSLMRG